MTLNCSRFLITQNKGDTMNIVEQLTGFISEVTQLERDNKILNEQLLELENEKSEGYKSFNTKTHVLLKREDLNDLLTALDNLTYTTSNTNDEVQQVQSNADDASYTARNAYDEAKECFKDLESLIVESEDEEDK